MRWNGGYGKDVSRMEPRTEGDVSVVCVGHGSGGHLVHFIRNVVSEELDLSEILNRYEEERGYPPYHPVMMTAVLLYANAVGIYLRAGWHGRVRNGWISWR